MDPPSALALLRETGAAERVGERAAQRLADVQSFFSVDMQRINARLEALVGQGVPPATDSALHLFRAGGKRIRPLTLLLAASCFGDVTEPIRELAVVAELVHLATLLHDDVLDDAHERRGMPTARKLWGNAVSILAGDLLLTHALERTSAVASPTIVADLFATLRKLVDGEVIQLRGRTRLDVGEGVYLRIVADKTASLFGWATRAGALAAGAPSAAVTALGAVGEHLGTAFQFVDDLLDYSGNSDVTGKSLYADLNEGKVTLPLILAIEERPSLMADLEAVRAGDEAATLRLVEGVSGSQSCAEVRRRAQVETQAAIAMLSEIQPSPARDLLGCVALELGTRAH